MLKDRCSNNSSHARLSEIHAESNRIHNKNWLFFPQEKLMTGMFPLVFEPSKNTPCIDE
jgi:hypothetical protein